MRPISLLVLCFTLSVGFANDSTTVKESRRTEHAMATDEFSYLEHAGDERTQRWIQSHNARTLQALEGDPRFDRYYALALAGSDSQSELGRMVGPGGLMLRDGWVYQVWSDSTHPKGIWRRVQLPSFRSASPQWQSLLDLDVLDSNEKKSWLFVSALISPNGQRALIRLAEGGSNVYEWREFDLENRAFVPDGFVIPLGLGAQGAWRDDDTLILTTNFGAQSVNAVGMPLVVRQWSRGQPFAAAREIFRGRSTDAEVAIDLGFQDGFPRGAPARRSTRPMTIRQMASNLDETWWLLDAAGRQKCMTLPRSFEGLMAHGDQYLVRLREDWAIGGSRWKSGSLVAIPASEITHDVPSVQLVLQPGQEESVIWANQVADGVIIIGSSVSGARIWTARVEDGRWLVQPVALPPNGSVWPAMADATGASAFFAYQSFLQPPTLYEVSVTNQSAFPVKSAPSQFSSSIFITEQLEARSVDGALVPYFITRLRTMRYDGRAPTLVYGYGSLGLSQWPLYSATLGKLWLEQGGVYVVANVRGGRERGHGWHVKGVDRQRTYDDMHAVLQDLIRRRITAPKRVAVTGMSAGGLLAGVMLTKHDELLGAAVLRVPLLDQLRLDLAMGADGIWDEEYGSPRIQREHDFLQATSPFQNLKRSANAPVPLILTASNDQNVFPAQSRRFVAKMEALGMSALFYESPEGGHAESATRGGQARLDALIFTYLAQQLFECPKSVH